MSFQHNLQHIIISVADRGQQSSLYPQKEMHLGEQHFEEEGAGVGGRTLE